MSTTPSTCEHPKSIFYVKVEVCEKCEPISTARLEFDATTSLVHYLEKVHWARDRELPLEILHAAVKLVDWLRKEEL